MDEILEGESLTQEINTLDGWALREDSKIISKTFKFKDFSQSWAFMSRIALEAEKMDHHPDWSNSYNKVEIALSTHSAGGLTMKDIALARKIDTFS